MYCLVVVEESDDDGEIDGDFSGGYGENEEDEDVVIDCVVEVRECD